MNGYFRKMIDRFISNFGRPDYDLGNDEKIKEADQLLDELEARRKNLERRQRLLEIQGNPRGMHG